MTTLQKLLASISVRLRSRYVRMLEGEVSRLRLENRALVNSLLGTAGFPPVLAEEDSRVGAVAMPAVRKRTWSQIAREREWAAGQNLAERSRAER